MMADLSPEQQFIAETVRLAFGMDPSTRASHIRHSSVDWEAILRLASREGLAPLAHSSLRFASLLVPDPVRAKLKMFYLAAVARTEVCREPALRRLLPGLENAGLHPIVLKGAALAYTAYIDPVHRTMADIDVLLPAEQMARAVAVLNELGFSPAGYEVGSDHHHLDLYHSAEWPLGVEIHHHLLPESNPYQISLKDCWARSETAEVAGVEGRVLAPVDALHLACVHLSYSHRYRWFLLRTLTDILAITTCRARDLDWDLFLEVIRSSRTAGAVYWPLLLARNWVGAPVPGPVLTGLAPPSAVARVIAAVASPGYLLGGRQPAEKADGVLRDLLLNLSLHQGCMAIDKAKAVARGLFPPPEAVGHLPSGVTRSRLRYAAYLARPDRMFRGIVAFGRLIARGV